MGRKFEIGNLEKILSDDKYLSLKFREKSITINLFKLLKEFETILTQSIRQILISRGVEKSSDLIDSIDMGYSGDFFQLLANDYYQYVSKGRKPKARKVPIKDLIQWIKDKAIPYTGSINQAAFAIQQGIYKRGIKGKLFEESVIDFSSGTISEIVVSSLQYGVVKGSITLWEVWDNARNKWISVVVKIRKE